MIMGGLKLSDLGSQIGALARRTDYLVAAIQDFSDDITTPDERSRTAVDRVLGFVDLIEETAAKSKALAEIVEGMGLDACRSEEEA